MDRMMAMYRRTGTNIISSKVDLQLSFIFDMSMDVLGNKRPEQSPSAIVPGLCKMCSMMITNLHEATHTSDHSFELDKERSAETLRLMLSAVISKDSNRANVRYDTLSLPESNNGFVKELRFKKKQNVACLTPVNSLLGAYESMTVHPGTMLIPTSEVFSCDGLDHDKFWSMVHRSSDPVLTDSSKSADSIVETLAGSSPNAEMLLYTYKDERRHLNSIPDCIIENMSENATSIYNTQCSQTTVGEDELIGLPVFVGRLNRKSSPHFAAPAMTGDGGVP
ncbi:hypothetical protein Pcinc_008587 [Petrolisthes cinctipes]|uniref:Uncharacterized protein n=1 Tax=Petrolisthes cinctipes TaxID=88211 RepID=A0AAE1G6A7_PETCI|nr:hypothetical protein Pcinc_008587 [Petrolisthes cinctipes]